MRNQFTSNKGEAERSGVEQGTEEETRTPCLARNQIELQIFKRSPFQPNPAEGAKGEGAAAVDCSVNYCSSSSGSGCMKMLRWATVLGAFALDAAAVQLAYLQAEHAPRSPWQQLRRGGGGGRGG